MLATHPFNKAPRELIVDVADANIGRVQRAVLGAIAALQSRVKLNALAAAISSKDITAALAIADPNDGFRLAAEGQGIAHNAESLKEALRFVFEAGAKFALRGLQRVPVRKLNVATQIRFDLTNPQAIEFLQNYSLGLITSINDETREGIRSVILNAFTEGGHPYEQAREIRDMIGLTRGQAQAVLNYRKELMGGDSGPLRAAVGRALRDGRFDRTIQRAIKEGVALKPEQIDQMTRRYYERSLKYRAETIARTESVRTANAGQQATWRMAVDQGLLNPALARQKWSVATDERLCPNCDRIASLNPDGVKLGEPFNTPYGPISYPPAHTMCRCSTYLSVAA